MITITMQPLDLKIPVVVESELPMFLEACRSTCSNLAKLEAAGATISKHLADGGAMTGCDMVEEFDHPIVLFLLDEYDEEMVYHEALHAVIDGWAAAGKRIKLGGKYDDSEILTYGQAHLVREIKRLVYDL